MSSTPAQPEQWPAVTVVLPTLGERADLLEEALAGVADQDYPGRVECLVVLDSRSPDAGPRAGSGPALVPDLTGSEAWESTRKVAAAAGAQVLENNRTPGLAGSRNTGITAAAGELVGFCDDDDRWLPGKLRAQVTAITADASATLVCCGIQLHYGDLVTERVHPARTVTFTELLRSRIMELHVSSFLLRKANLGEIGMVNEKLPGSRAEDYEFMLRIARRGPILNVPVAGVKVMWHVSRKAMWGNWPVVLKALPWVLEQYPEFKTVPAGYARIAGQVAFAAASAGDRPLAWQWIGKTLRANPREPRAYIAMAVAYRLVTPGAVVRALHKRGKGL